MVWDLREMDVKPKNAVLIQEMSSMSFKTVQYSNLGCAAPLLRKRMRQRRFERDLDLDGTHVEYFLVEIVATQLKIPEAYLRHMRETHTREIVEVISPYLEYTCGYMYIEIKVRDKEDMEGVIRSFKD